MSVALLLSESVVVASEPGSVVGPSVIVALLADARVVPVSVALLLGESVVVAFEPGSVVGPSLLVL